MLLLPRAVRVYVATYPVSLRKSIDGLSNEVEFVLDRDPLSGHVFVFINRRKTQVKLLLWTRGGYTVVHKRLEKGRFNFIKQVAPGAKSVQIDVHELSMLLEGLLPQTSRGARRWEPRKSAPGGTQQPFSARLRGCARSRDDYRLAHRDRTHRAHLRDHGRAHAGNNEAASRRRARGRARASRGAWRRCRPGHRAAGGARARRGQAAPGREATAAREGRGDCKQCCAFSHHIGTTSQQVSGGTHGTGIDVGLRKHARARQQRELLGVDRVVFDLAAVEGAHVERVPEDERDVVVGAQVRQPVPGKGALGGDHHVTAVGLQSTEQRLGLCRHLPMQYHLTVVSHDADVHRPHVKIDPADVRVPSGIESHPVSSVCLIHHSGCPEWGTSGEAFTFSSACR